MPVIPLNADIRVHASLDNDISPCAVDYGFNLGLFGLRHSELVERLLKIIEKSLPLGRRDHKIFVRSPSWSGRCTFAVRRPPSRAFP